MRNGIAKHSGPPVAIFRHHEFNEIDLEITGQRIIRVTEGPDRHRTANRITDTSESALTAEGLFANLPQQPAGGSADLAEPLSDLLDSDRCPSRSSSRLA
jgi:hypothetical protein